MDISDEELTDLLVKALLDVGDDADEQQRYPALTKMMQLCADNPQRAVLTIDEEMSRITREAQDHVLRSQDEVYSEEEMWDQRRVYAQREREAGNAPSARTAAPAGPAKAGVQAGSQPSGRRPSIEPRMRRVVADHLGVGPEELTPEVSLVDQLAVDSLDLLDLTLALESELGVILPESTLERVRTYGDLVAAASAYPPVRRTRGTDRMVGYHCSVVWAVVPATGGTAVERVAWLTASIRETIADDALRAGRGAHLELSVPSGVSDASICRLLDEFRWLQDRDISVAVLREHDKDVARDRDREGDRVKDVKRGELVSWDPTCSGSARAARSG
jgi:acyl carrier protein